MPPDNFKEMEELKQSVLDMMNNMESFISSMFVKAKLCRAYYLALIKEGFSEAEALELCKTFNMGM